MIPIEILMLYGFAAILAGIAMWVGDEQERRYWRKKNKEIKERAWAAIFRDLDKYKGIVKKK